MGMTYQTSALLAIVAIILVSLAAIVGLGIAGRIDADSTPLLVTILGIVTTVVATLLNTIRTDRVADKVSGIESKAEAIERRINGDGPGISPHP